MDAVNQITNKVAANAMAVMTPVSAWNVFPSAPQEIGYQDKLDLDNYVIQYVKSPKRFTLDGKQAQDMLETLSVEIERRKQAASVHFLYIGKLLAEMHAHFLFESSVYGSFEKYCAGRFDFGRSTLYNFLNVYKIFAERMRKEEKYAKFQYSQLVELLPIADCEQVKEVEPSWSINRIRALKKYLMTAKAAAEGPKAKKPKPTFEDKIRKQLTQADYEELCYRLTERDFNNQTSWRFERTVKTKTNFSIVFLDWEKRDPSVTLSQSWKTGSSSLPMPKDEFLSLTYDGLVAHILSNYPDDVKGVKAEINVGVIEFKSLEEVKKFIDDYKSWPCIGTVPALGMSFYRCYFSNDKQLLVQHIVNPGTDKPTVYYQWVSEAGFYIQANLHSCITFIDNVIEAGLKASFAPFKNAKAEKVEVKKPHGKKESKEAEKAS